MFQSREYIAKILQKLLVHLMQVQCSDTRKNLSTVFRIVHKQDETGNIGISGFTTKDLLCSTLMPY